MTEREHCELFARVFIASMTDWAVDERRLADWVESARARARNEALEEAASLAQAATDDDWDCGEVERRIRALVKP